jgi:hypothetical protein
MPSASLITNTAAAAASSSGPAWQASVVEECEPDDAPLELLEPRDGTDEFDVRHALPATMSYLHLVRPYTRMQEANQRAVQAAQDAKWRSDKARARMARSERVAAAESNRKDDARLRHRVGLELLRTPHAGGPQQRAQLLAAMALAAPRELQPLPDGTTRVDGESAITVAEGLNRWRVRAAAKYEAQAAQELEPAALGVVPPSPPPMDVALASGQSPRPSPFASTPFVLPTPTAAALRGLFQWKAGAGGDAAKARSTDTLLSPTYFPRLPHASDPPPEMTPPGSTLLMFPLHLDGAAAAARRASTASLPFRDSARDDSAWAVGGSPAGLPPPLQISSETPLSDSGGSKPASPMELGGSHATTTTRNADSRSPNAAGMALAARQSVAYLLEHSLSPQLERDQRFKSRAATEELYGAPLRSLGVGDIDDGCVSHAVGVLDDDLHAFRIQRPTLVLLNRPPSLAPPAGRSPSPEGRGELMPSSARSHSESPHSSRPASRPPLSVRIGSPDTLRGSISYAPSPRSTAGGVAGGSPPLPRLFMEESSGPMSRSTSVKVKDGVVARTSRRVSIAPAILARSGSTGSIRRADSFATSVAAENRPSPLGLPPRGPSETSRRVSFAATDRLPPSASPSGESIDGCASPLGGAPDLMSLMGLDEEYRVVRKTAFELPPTLVRFNEGKKARLAIARAMKTSTRFVVEAVRRPSARRITEDHVLQCMGEHARWVTLEFHHRGGTFISVLSAEPLMALRAVHALLQAVRCGESAEITAAYVAQRHNRPEEMLVESPRSFALVGEELAPFDESVDWSLAPIVKAVQPQYRRRRLDGKLIRVKDDDGFVAEGDEFAPTLKDSVAEAIKKAATAGMHSNVIPAGLEDQKVLLAGLETDDDEEDGAPPPLSKVVTSPPSAFRSSSPSWLGKSPSRRTLGRSFGGESEASALIETLSGEQLRASGAGEGPNAGEPLTPHSQAESVEPSTAAQRTERFIRLNARKDRVAIVCAITDFGSGLVESHGAAPADADALEALLRPMGYFIVRMRCDAAEDFLLPTAVNIKRMVRGFLRAVPHAAADVALFVFSRGYTGVFGANNDKDVAAATAGAMDGPSPGAKRRMEGRRASVRPVLKPPGAAGSSSSKAKADAAAAAKKAAEADELPQGGSGTEWHVVYAADATLETGVTHTRGAILPASFAVARSAYGRAPFVFVDALPIPAALSATKVGAGFAWLSGDPTAVEGGGGSELVATSPPLSQGPATYYLLRALEGGAVLAAHRDGEAAVSMTVNDLICFMYPRLERRGLAVTHNAVPHHAAARAHTPFHCQHVAPTVAALRRAHLQQREAEALATCRINLALLCRLDAPAGYHNDMMFTHSLQAALRKLVDESARQRKGAVGKKGAARESSLTPRRRTSSAPRAGPRTCAS